MKRNKTLMAIFIVSLAAHIVFLSYVGLPDFRAKNRVIKLDYQLDEPEKKAPAPKVSEPPKALPPPRAADTLPTPEPQPTIEPEPLQPISFPEELVETSKAVVEEKRETRRSSSPARRSVGPARGTGAYVAAPQAPPPKIDVDALVRDYGRNVAAMIERRKEYPKRAQKFGVQGRVDLAFTVAANGALLGTAVTSSSGDNSLDEAAVKAVEAAAPFPALPREIGMESIQLSVSLLYKIN